MTTPTPAAGQPAAAGTIRRTYIFIPQTDQAVGSWIKTLEKYPRLRLVIALSPRFQRFIKEPALKESILALHRGGRLEFALQIPNAPFLPLLINTDSARVATPPGTPLPTPAFAYPEDVTQIVAKARSEFIRIWGISPSGLILPQGAANYDLLKQLNQLGWKWAVGALALPSHPGVYKLGSLHLWDATPLQEHPQFTVHVYDERAGGTAAASVQMLNNWGQDLVKSPEILLGLPSDSDIPQVDLERDMPVGNRTWQTADWTPWIGTPAKNAAWTWLRTTREALERYKNSGRASVRRLDMAFEEVYNAENANFFFGISEGQAVTPQSEERQREFQATLSSVYRLIGQPPPDNLFTIEGASLNAGLRASSTTIKWETIVDGRGHLAIEDASGDDKGDGSLADPLSTSAVPGAYDLRRVDVWSTAETLDWSITLGTIPGSKLGDFETSGPLIDIYIDLNGAPNVGTLSLLPGRRAGVATNDAWEYALVLSRSHAQIYRTRGTESYDLTDTVPMTFDGDRLRFSLPRTWLRGNPQRWGYQVLVMSYDRASMENAPRPWVTPEMTAARRPPIFDLIDPLDIPQQELLSRIHEGTRNDIPFIRVETPR